MEYGTSLFVEDAKSEFYFIMTIEYDDYQQRVKENVTPTYRVYFQTTRDCTQPGSGTNATSTMLSLLIIEYVDFSFLLRRFRASLLHGQTPIIEVPHPMSAIVMAQQPVSLTHQAAAPIQRHGREIQMLFPLNSGEIIIVYESHIFR